MNLLYNTFFISIIKLFIGGGLYYTLEIIARGRSHWSMFLLGGLCFLTCGLINSRLGNEFSLPAKMTLCMIAITILELLTGIIVNGFFGWQIWDYSGMPLQLFGQICVPFMFLWYVISYPAILLNMGVDKLIVFLR